MDDYFSGFLDDIAAQDSIDFGEDFSSDDLLNNLYLADWNNDPTSTIFDGMVSDGNGNWYSNPNDIINQPDFDSGGGFFSNLFGGGNLFNTLGQLGSAALVGRNIYESNQTNQLNQDMLRAQIEAAKAKLIQDSKLADSATYSKYTNDASAHTTSARDNALLRHYLEQTQPYNRERELAILGQNGVDIGGLQALRNSQIPKQNDYVKDLLGYENRFNSYADDMINMRNQDQLYNSLNPNIGGQTGQSFDWQSTIPDDADPALVEEYLRYIGVNHPSFKGDTGARDIRGPMEEGVSRSADFNTGPWQGFEDPDSIWY